MKLSVFLRLRSLCERPAKGGIQYILVLRNLWCRWLTGTLGAQCVTDFSPPRASHLQPPDAIRGEILVKTLDTDWSRVICTQYVSFDRYRAK